MVAWLSLVAVAGGAHAQNLQLRPTLQSRLSFSDNIRASDSDKESGWVFEVAPGLGGVAGDAGRLSGQFNLALRNTGYSSDRGWRDPAPSLQATGQLEALEDLLFIRADAAITQRNLDPFTGRSGSDDLDSSRRDQTRSFSLAPRTEFSLGSHADVRIAYRQTWLSGGSNTLNAQRRGVWNMDLSSPRGGGPLGWGLAYARTTSEYDGDVSDVTLQVLRGTLSYAITPQFGVRAIAGRERNDFGNGRAQRDSITGGGFDWFPTPRTRITATLEDRFFGDGYNLSASHRIARSTFQLSASRDVRSSIERFGSVFQDPFFASLFASQPVIDEYPDPVEREAVLRALLGLTNNDFISNSYFIEERLRAGYIHTGRRNSLSVSLSRSESTRIDEIAGLRPEDVLAGSDRVTTQGVAIGFNHRLDGRSSINASIAGTYAERTRGIEEETRRLTTSLGYTTRLGPRSVAGLSYRYQRAERDRDRDFAENVISASMNMRF